MKELLLLALGVCVAVAVFRYLGSGEEDSHLGVRVRARLERFERYRRLPEPVFDMNALEFGEYIAGLCRRDGCTDVQRVTGGNSLGADVIGCLPDGRKAVVQCVREWGDRPVDPRHVRTFHDAARARFGAEVTVLVVLGPLTGRERRAAARRRLTLIDADRLESWMRGTALSALLAPEAGRRGTNRTGAHG